LNTYAEPASVLPSTSSYCEPTTRYSPSIAKDTPNRSSCSGSFGRRTLDPGKNELDEDELDDLLLELRLLEEKLLEE
jgi:hypothetical protein